MPLMAQRLDDALQVAVSNAATRGACDTQVALPKQPLTIDN